MADIHYTLIGGGEEYDNLNNLVNEYDLNSKVSLLGVKANPFIYVKQADLFILSSLFFFREGDDSKTFSNLESSL